MNKRKRIDPDLIEDFEATHQDGAHNHSTPQPSPANDNSSKQALINELTIFIASSFVRREQHFYHVTRPLTKLTKGNAKQLAFWLINQRFSDRNLTQRAMEKAFSEAIAEDQKKPIYAIPLWDGSMTCKPDSKDRVLKGSLMVQLNSWQEPDYRSLGVYDADLTMLEAFLRFMFPREEDVQIFLNWLASCLQNEGDKPGWAPVLYSRQKGTGKSTLCQLVVALFGEQNSITLNSVEKLTARFNQPILTRKFLVCEELKLKPGSPQGNTLKTFITERSVSTERKGIDVEKVDQVCSFMFTTNHLPQWIEAGERRYLVIDTGHSGHASGPEAETFAEQVAAVRAYFDDPANVARVYNALMQRRLPNSFNPHSLNLSTLDSPVMKQIASTSAEVTVERLDELLAEDGRAAIPQTDLTRMVRQDLGVNANRLNHLMPDLGWHKAKVKWGGVDYTRAIWVKSDFTVDGGRVRGPDGYNHPIDQQPSRGDFTFEEI